MHEILNKRKKGMTSLEAVIGTMIFLMLFTALLDLILLSNRYLVLNNTAKELTRTLSVQGGALSDKPDGYASNYYTIEEISQKTYRNMKAAGFKDGEWAVVIEFDRYFNDTTQTTENLGYYMNLGIIGFTSSKTLVCNETPKLDYLSNFNVRIQGVYKWMVLPEFIGDRTTAFMVTMPGTSEWKYNYDMWGSEV